MFEKRKLKNCIRYYRHHQKWLGFLLEIFDINEYNYFFVGGFVRWVLDKNFSNSGPRDFDIIVDIPKKDLESLLKKCNIPFKKNEMGGFKIPPSDFDTFANKEIDVWTLDSHSPLKTLLKHKGIPDNCKIGKLFKWISRSAFLSIDSGIYWVNKNKLCATACKKSLKERMIWLTDELCLSYQNIDRKSLVAKLIYYYQQGYILDSNCWNLIKNYFYSHNFEYEKIVKWLDKHYRHVAVVLSWDEFIKLRIILKILAR